MKVDRNTFSTDGQYRKFLKVKALFKSYIKLSNTGHVFYDDYNEFMGKPYIYGHEIGFKDGGCRVVFVGATEDDNGKPWVDISVSSIKKDINIYKKVKV